MEEKLMFWSRYSHKEFLRLYSETDLEFSKYDTLRVQLEVWIRHGYSGLPVARYVNERIPMLSFKSFTEDFMEDMTLMVMENLEQKMVRDFPTTKTDIEESSFNFIVEKRDEDGYLDYKLEREDRVKS